jgi:phospholipase D3/4
VTWQFLHDLNSIANIEVRFMIIPDMVGLPPAPYSRVNHAKFMVSDNTAYIGTSNWSAEYPFD